MNKKILMRYCTVFLIFIFLGVSFLFLKNIAQTKHSNNLTVSFLDVGQGDAILIQTPNKTRILIDGGRDKTILTRLPEVMPLFDKRIDIVLATHPDLDHIGGLAYVLDRYTSTLFIDSGAQNQNGVYDEIEKKILKKRLQNEIEVREAFSGQEINFGGGVVLSILYPNRDVHLETDTNNASIVALLTYGKTTFLMTGDAPVITEYQIVDKLPEHINVLKAGHHGSNTSTSDTLLARIHPDYTVLSVGKNNTYGHPHQEVLDRLKQYNSKILRTDTDGTITFVSDGQTVTMQK